MLLTVFLPSTGRHTVNPYLGCISILGEKDFSWKSPVLHFVPSNSCSPACQTQLSPQTFDMWRPVSKCTLWGGKLGVCTRVGGEVCSTGPGCQNTPTGSTNSAEIEVGSENKQKRNSRTASVQGLILFSSLHQRNCFA